MNGCPPHHLGTGFIVIERTIPAGETLVAERRKEGFRVPGALWMPLRLTLWPARSEKPPGPGPCLITDVVAGGLSQVRGPWEVTPEDYARVVLPVAWSVIDPEKGIQFTIHSPLRAVHFIAILECGLYRKSEET